jgi:mono/diheme cytochrome c family protein
MGMRSEVAWSAVGATLAAIAWYVVPAIAQTTAPQSAALASFEKVRVVFQHPRCANCHIPGDAPLQYDDGRPHAQSVVRGDSGHGFVVMECSSCHGDENKPASYGDRAPPGAPNWHLPPPETKMVFIALSPRALCETIKNRRETGGKDLAAMFAHVRDDKLVGWGWNPGGQRTRPPISRQETVAAFKTWMDAGAPCPAQ